MKNRSVLQAVLLCGLCSTMLAFELPPAPAPPENPITEEKRVLGKILFWEEQLSSDNTISCGTCHRPGVGGADPRFAVNPGADQIFGTDDDTFGTLGVIRADASDNYVPDPNFGFSTQVTPRNSPTFIVSQYSPNASFWDGRATGEFIDPQTGLVSIPSGGALESQAVGPVLSDVEMAHMARDWAQVAQKLEAARPMALATDIPPDMQAAIDANPDYPQLFEEAFGDSAITAERIAFAIATYERTLVPDQTPWDDFDAGNTEALTPNQQIGLAAFQNTTCDRCHLAPLFTENSFRVVGVRPWQEDPGRMDVTGNFDDRGKFKVPSLRNVGLRDRFMHNGRFGTLEEVLDFYLDETQQFTENQDPLMFDIEVPKNEVEPLIDFLRHGLTDPRVAAEEFPFDRPTMHSERTPANPLLIGSGGAGSGGFTPAMIAVAPPNLGNEGFKIGVFQGLGGANAFVGVSTLPPVGGMIDPMALYGPFALEGAAPGEGYATFHWPIPDDPDLIDQVRYMQWFIEDPQGTGGMAMSPVAELTFFCTTCPPPSAPLEDVVFAFGSQVTGDMSDLLVSDDSHLVGTSQFGFSALEPNITDVIIGATSSVPSPTTLDLLVEARLDNPGGSAKLRMKNWSTRQFQQVHAYQIGANEIATEVEDIAAANHVRSKDSRIELSFRTSVIATFSATGYRVFIDHVEITAE